MLAMLSALDVFLCRKTVGAGFGDAQSHSPRTVLVGTQHLPIVRI